MKRLTGFVIIAMFVLPAFLAIQLNAATNSNWRSITTVGAWQIDAEKDAMTDKLSCVAFYENKPAIQLTLNSFDISLRGRGGVGGITIRFDDKPANRLRLPSKIEKQLSIVSFTNSKFQELLQSNRVRVQVLTVLDQIVNEDINLKDLEAARAVLKSDKCGSPGTS